MGKLSAEALTSEFSKTILAGFVTGADLFINPIGKAVQSALPDVLKGAAGAGASWAWSFIFGVDDALKSNAAQEALKAAFEGAGAGGAFDRPLDQRGGGGTPATDVFNAVANLENAAAAIEAAAAAAAATTAREPFPGLSQSEIDAITASAVAAAIAAALATTTAAAAVTPGPGVTQLEGTTAGSVVDVLTGAGPSAEHLAGGGPTGAEILAWLGTSGGQQMIGQGPPNIVINAPAVSGQEVVEALGKYVDGNGPLPPHWQQSAN
jgi:hypothetical protein